MFTLLTNDTYKTIIANTVEGILICSKKLCPHCKNMEKVLEKFSKKAPSAALLQLDLEDSAAACAELGAERAPTVFVIKGGVIKIKKAGLMNPKEMISFYENAK